MEIKPYIISSLLIAGATAATFHYTQILNTQLVVAAPLTLIALTFTAINLYQKSHPTTYDLDEKLIRACTKKFGTSPHASAYLAQKRTEYGTHNFHGKLHLHQYLKTLNPFDPATTALKQYYTNHLSPIPGVMR